jgi:uncharacterized oligopeptide transporter (OPT) family protein
MNRKGNFYRGLLVAFFTAVIVFLGGCLWSAVSFIDVVKQGQSSPNWGHLFNLVGIVILIIVAIVLYDGSYDGEGHKWEFFLIIPFGIAVFGLFIQPWALIPIILGGVAAYALNRMGEANFG